MKNTRVPFSLTRALAFLALVVVSFTQSANAQVYINEIYFDPPGASGDLLFEYFEFRGTPSKSLADHYLVFLENETGLTGPTAGTRQGRIDAIVDFNIADNGSVASLGTNGFLTIPTGQQLLRCTCSWND